MCLWDAGNTVRRILTVGHSLTLGVDNDLLKVENYVCIKVTAADQLSSALWWHGNQAEQEGNFYTSDTVCSGADALPK